MVQGTNGIWCARDSDTVSLSCPFPRGPGIPRVSARPWIWNEEEADGVQGREVVGEKSVSTAIDHLLWDTLLLRRSPALSPVQPWRGDSNFLRRYAPSISYSKIASCFIRRVMFGMHFAMFVRNLVTNSLDASILKNRMLSSLHRRSSVHEFGRSEFEMLP